MNQLNEILLFNIISILSATTSISNNHMKKKTCIENSEYLRLQRFFFQHNADMTRGEIKAWFLQQRVVRDGHPSRVKTAWGFVAGFGQGESCG